jgi:protein phosphatase
MSASSDTETLNSVEARLGKLAASYFGYAVEQVQVSFGAATHPGKVRKTNEDHYAVTRRYRAREVLLTNLPPTTHPPLCDKSYVLAVADGVGGAAFGELASLLALKAGYDLTTTAFKWGFTLSEQEVLELSEGIRTHVRMIHRKLREAAAGSDSPLAGMGTTLTGALTIGLNAFVAHVGDSRAYLFREGRLHRLTRDHTLAEQLVANGVAKSVDDASVTGFRSVLINCLGGEFDDVNVDVCHVPLHDSDLILLCSDGLSDMVPDDDIATILSGSRPVQDSCQLLIDAALAYGGKDNVTVVLGQWHSECAAP